MHIFIFVFLLVVIEASNYKIHKKTNGFDHRIKTSDYSPLLVHNIAKLLEKKRLLDILKNPHVSIHDKISILDKPSLEPPNIKSGGLMKDWEEVCSEEQA